MSTPNNQPKVYNIADTFYVSQHEISETPRQSAIRNLGQSTPDLLAQLKEERSWADRGTRVTAMGRRKSKKYFLSTLPNKTKGFDITEADAPKGLDRAKFQAEVEACGNKGIGSKVIELAGNEPDELSDLFEHSGEEHQVA